MTLIVSLVCSAIYTLTIATGPFPGRWAVKTASIAALAVMARRHPVLALALAFGSLGDALLDLSSSYFVYGLVAFLCGHIAYTVYFARTGDSASKIAAAALAAYSIAYLAWLWPGLGAMRIPVVFYVAAITVMAVTSFRLGWVVAAGAVLFLISDSLLAANRFRMPVPGRDWLVWLTYYFGQLAIATGALQMPGVLRRQPAGPLYPARARSTHSG